MKITRHTIFGRVTVTACFIGTRPCVTSITRVRSVPRLCIAIQVCQYVSKFRSNPHGQPQFPPLKLHCWVSPIWDKPTSPILFQCSTILWSIFLVIAWHYVERHFRLQQWPCHSPRRTTSNNALLYKSCATLCIAWRFAILCLAWLLDWSMIALLSASFIQCLDSRTSPNQGIFFLCVLDLVEFLNAQVPDCGASWGFQLERLTRTHMLLLLATFGNFRVFWPI